ALLDDGCDFVGDADKLLALLCVEKEIVGENHQSAWVLRCEGARCGCSVLKCGCSEPKCWPSVSGVAASSVRHKPCSGWRPWVRDASRIWSFGGSAMIFVAGYMHLLPVGPWSKTSDFAISCATPQRRRHEISLKDSAAIATKNLRNSSRSREGHCL